MNFRRGGFWLVGFGYAVTLGACVGVSSEVGSMNDGGGGQGNECEAGDQKPADDGCNTCTCDSEGNWACTQIACSCEEGAMRPAGDGCNTCVCSEGSWACTLQDCQSCAIGDKTTDGCNSCECREINGAATWTCTANVCPECMPGETKPAGDGCNTCMCFEGSWGCTMKLCGDPGVCDAGAADCNGDPADGCETNIQTDVSNCGTCGNLCNFAGAAGACENGQCAVGECQSGYADCNGVVEDGCEAPVGPGGCIARCDVSGMVPAEPVPATGECQCPAGTVCVRGSVEDQDPDSEYCYPIPEGCANGFASCDCMETCACPGNADAVCYDQMAIGGVFIINCPGYPSSG